MDGNRGSGGRRWLALGLGIGLTAAAIGVVPKVVSATESADRAAARPDDTAIMQDTLSGDRTYSDTDAALTTHTDWMGKLPSSTPLGGLSIPGTHDSVARYGVTGYGDTTAADQGMSVTHQLESGIRYLDIRTSCEGNKAPFTLEGWHGDILGGVDQHIDLKAVLDEVSAFLKAHPKELVLMELSGNGVRNKVCADGTNQKEIFLDRYWNLEVSPGKGLFWKPKQRDPLPPTLGEAAGQIVVIQGNTNSWYYVKGESLVPNEIPLGLNTESFDAPTQGSGTKPVTSIDRPDPCNSPSDLSFTTIQKFADNIRSIQLAQAQSAAEAKVHIQQTGLEGTNLTCGLSPLTVQTSRDTASTNNPLVTSWLLDVNDPRPVGMVTADWPGPALIDAILVRNLNLVSNVARMSSDFNYAVQSLAFVPHTNSGDQPGKADGRLDEMRTYWAAVMPNRTFGFAVVDGQNGWISPHGTVAWATGDSNGYRYAVWSNDEVIPYPYDSGLYSSFAQELQVQVDEIVGPLTNDSESAQSKGEKLYKTLSARYPGAICTVVALNGATGWDNWTMAAESAGATSYKKGTWHNTAYWVSCTKVGGE